MTKEQKKATRQALRRYGEGSVCAAWAQVIGAVLAWYDRNDPVCAQLLTDFTNGLSCTLWEHVVSDKLSCTVGHFQCDGTFFHGNETWSVNVS